MIVHTRRFWTKALICFLLAWLCILFYLLVPLLRSTEAEERITRQLMEANGEIERLTADNNGLRLIIKRLKDSNSTKTSFEIGQIDTVGVPSLEYERFRQRLRRDMAESWRFVNAKLEDLKNAAGKDTTNVIQKDFRDRYNTLVADFDELSRTDGYGAWRRKEAKDLSDLVQKRLHHLQNPDDCSTAKKLVCKLNKGCGYGCQIHHAVYCLIVAYGTERTLILKSRGWRYNRGGFEEVFKPLSDTCVDSKGSTHTLWPGTPDTQVVDIPIIDSVNPRPKFLPPAIPRDLADRISKIHGDPIVWWVSEFLRYILRPQEATKKMLKDIEKSHQMTRPMVGIHIRRTDKVGTEADFHGVEEYMKHVGDYFSMMEVKNGQALSIKTVYVATDDSKVLAECRKKFPDYVFIGDQSIAKSAAVLSRYNLNSLKGIISDIHMLSLSDYLVCTFSSQVCRMAYEIQQQRYDDDASWRFKSLDDIWYFGGQNDHQQEAIIPHKAGDQTNEIDINVGDVIGVAGNHWNGFNKGHNYASKKIGLYPEYKTKEKLRVVDFPTYSNVQL